MILDCSVGEIDQEVIMYIVVRNINAKYRYQSINLLVVCSSTTWRSGWGSRAMPACTFIFKVWGQSTQAALKALNDSKYEAVINFVERIMCSNLWHINVSPISNINRRERALKGIWWGIWKNVNVLSININSSSVYHHRLFISSADSRITVAKQERA
jgi:hypothetical protein